jgi:hypothetical protein
MPSGRLNVSASAPLPFLSARSAIFAIERRMKVAILGASVG